MEVGRIYHFGYGGRKFAELKTLAQAGALIVDVRMKPFSWQSEWMKGSMIAALGESYYHAKGFGNKNYKSGPTELLNEAQEVLELSQVLSQSRDVVLVCACKSFRECHRKLCCEVLSKATGAEVFNAITGEQEGVSEIGGESNTAGEVKTKWKRKKGESKDQQTLF